MTSPSKVLTLGRSRARDSLVTSCDTGASCEAGESDGDDVEDVEEISIASFTIWLSLFNAASWGSEGEDFEEVPITSSAISLLLSNAHN